MLRVPLADLEAQFARVLTKVGVASGKSAVVARVLAENQRDGIQSHGLNRFRSLVDTITRGLVVPSAEPRQVGGGGALEQWDGGSGLGPWNARVAMARAVTLARTHGLGCVALRRTSHWMRAGAYALQATEAGCIGICWTNTMPLMPPWGSAEAKVGNNPLAIAIPPAEQPLLLDMAMSQYANGKLEVHRRAGKPLPEFGGYDRAGQLTRDPGEILASRRPLPVGLWKGSSLAAMLDLLAALLSGGNTTEAIGRQGAEKDVSQVFVALNLAGLADRAALARVVEAVVADLKSAAPLAGGSSPRYPGEAMLQARRASEAEGVAVDLQQWEDLQRM
jgi:3-dehydro-L-gulonate 2-dehydrogenase